FLASFVLCVYERLVPRRAAPDPPVAASVLPAAKVTSLEPSTGPSEIKTAVNPKDGQKYVWTPPGSFTMGCSAADNECKDDEKPAHRVRIPAGFWLAQTEVTNAAYRTAAPAKASKAKSDAAMPIQGLS